MCNLHLQSAGIFHRELQFIDGFCEQRVWFSDLVKCFMMRNLGFRGPVVRSSMVQLQKLMSAAEAPQSMESSTRFIME